MPMNTFHEFPKWVYPENGKPVIVANAEEEAALLTVEQTIEPAIDTPNPAPKTRGRKANDPQRSDTPSTQAS